MITEFAINSVEGAVDSIDALSRQRYPKINVNLDSVDAKEDRLTIKYSFVADYLDGEATSAKSLGHMKLTGIVQVKEPKGEIDSIMKRWNDQHTLPTQLAEEVINGLNFRCSASGTLIAYSLGLIPPLGISTIKIQEQK